MGRDKALLSVDGLPMAQRVASALRSAGAIDVVCIGGDAAGLHAVGLETVEDRYPDEGPLGGFITALRWSSTAITVVSPCDLMTPVAASFAALVAALTESDAAAALPIVDGEPRTMPVALRTTAVDALDAAFTEGARAAYSVRSVIEWVAVDAGPLADADSPEDLRPRR